MGQPFQHPSKLVSTKLRILMRRREVVRLEGDGLSLRKIARAVGVSHETVRKDMNWWIRQLCLVEMRRKAVLRHLRRGLTIPEIARAVGGISEIARAVGASQADVREDLKWWINYKPPREPSREEMELSDRVVARQARISYKASQEAVAFGEEVSRGEPAPG